MTQAKPNGVKMDGPHQNGHGSGAVGPQHVGIDLVARQGSVGEVQGKLVPALQPLENGFLAYVMQGIPLALQNSTTRDLWLLETTQRPISEHCILASHASISGVGTSVV